MRCKEHERVCCEICFPPIKEIERSQVECEIIKPCPFCGGEAIVVNFDGGLEDYAKRVGCKDKDCPGSHVWEDTTSEAMKAWNKRAL